MGHHRRGEGDGRGRLAAGAEGGGQEPGAAHAAPPRKLYTLRVAEILLVGQVVAYDRSTREIKGGAAVGAVGASGAYVTDLVTFSLRAVAVQSGEILGETTVTKQRKEIEKQLHVQLGLFDHLEGEQLKAQRDQRDGELRDVRLGRRLAVHGRSSGQVGRGGRDHCRAPRAARDRGVLAAA